MSAATAKPLTAAQIKRRAAYGRLLASLPVPQNTSLAHSQAVKAKPGSGVMGTV